jgi:TFIIF-interacting CTD phosphatase-like protein
VTVPFLPEKSTAKNHPKYTLILDLDETLVHYVEVINSFKNTNK